AFDLPSGPPPRAYSERLSDRDLELQPPPEPGPWRRVVEGERCVPHRAEDDERPVHGAAGQEREGGVAGRVVGEVDADGSEAGRDADPDPRRDERGPVLGHESVLAVPRVAGEDAEVGEGDGLERVAQPPPQLEVRLEQQLPA